MIPGLQLIVHNSRGKSRRVTTPSGPVALDFGGKKSCFIGDSITAGYVSASSAADFPIYRWSALLANNCNGVEDNKGLSGQVLEPVNVSGHGIFDLNSIPAKGTEYKYLFFNLGVNDMNLAANGFTVAGYTTRLQAVVDKALTLGWVAADLVLMTPFWITDAGAPRQLQEDYAKAVRDKAQENGTILLDTYLFGKNSTVYQNSGMADTLHPNQTGHQMLYEFARDANYTPSAAVLGTVYTKSTFVDSAGYTPAGTTLSLDGSGLRMQFGAGGTVDLDAQYNDGAEKYVETLRFKVGSATEGTGVLLGVKATYSDYFGVIYTGGVVKLCAYNSRGGTVQGSSTLAYSLGDILEYVHERDETENYLRVRNLTTSSAFISQTFSRSVANDQGPIQHGIGSWQIQALGGSVDITVTYHQLYYKQQRNAKLLVVGDSKVAGYSAGGRENRLINLLRAHYGSCVGVTGAGDNTAQLATTLPRILDLRPEYVLIEMGQNGWQAAHYQSFCTSLSDAGIKFLFIASPTFDKSNKDFYDWQNLNYPGKVVPWGSMLEAGSDYLLKVEYRADTNHVNAAGNPQWAQMIIDSGLIV